ncbi:unnamed protein product [Polarella glacialis]|uniref:Glutamine amidotransferase type-2 domain-containing protein n=1 Tax=Polarella glacialis TaxID=89957 RepID=A0A813FFM7_POLGL|nr:unnamed protein product [Polarella glacialis]
MYSVAADTHKLACSVELYQAKYGYSRLPASITEQVEQAAAPGDTLLDFEEPVLEEVGAAVGTPNEDSVDSKGEATEVTGHADGAALALSGNVPGGEQESPGGPKNQIAICSRQVANRHHKILGLLLRQSLIIFLVCSKLRKLLMKLDSANGNIDFLCHKFSGLLERLQKSEAGEREALESCAQLEAQLVTRDLEEDAERRELEAADAAAREEIRKFESSLTEAAGFLLASFLLPHLTALFNAKMKLRGPDVTSRMALNGIEFVHNLLHLTGPPTAQPVVEPGGASALVFNGEIYNYAALAEELGKPPGLSEAAVLLPAYRRWGPGFLRRLDGEFALALVDFQGDASLLLATDAFGTKPLWLAGKGTSRWAAASYESALLALGFHDAELIPANTVLQCSLAPSLVCRRSTLRRFDLRQFKTSTSDWMAAFSRSVAKRVEQGSSVSEPRRVFLGLSAGHDSGAIHAELLKQRRPHVAYAVLGPEDLGILRARARLAEEVAAGEDWVAWSMLDVSREQFQWEKEWAKKFTENFTTVNEHDGEVYVALDNPALTGTSIICREASAAGLRVMLSGQGADETMTNYFDRGRRIMDLKGVADERPLANASGFTGFYPDRLFEVFPWTNFFRGTNQVFMQTIEAACGAHGIESRYPFLDPAVVQEWLWLTPEAKHAAYKAPIEELMTKAGYPFQPSLKNGFGANKQLKEGRWRGRAWVKGPVLQRSPDSAALPPPFRLEMSSFFEDETIFTLDDDRQAKEDFVRSLWSKCLFFSYSDLLLILLVRSCFRHGSNSADSLDCAAALLNWRDPAGDTGLLVAAAQDKQELLLALASMACSFLPKGSSWQLGVLSVTNKGRSLRKLLRKEHGNNDNNDSNKNNNNNSNSNSNNNNDNSSNNNNNNDNNNNNNNVNNRIKNNNDNSNSSSSNSSSNNSPVPCLADAACEELQMAEWAEEVCTTMVPTNLILPAFSEVPLGPLLDFAELILGGSLRQLGMNEAEASDYAKHMTELLHDSVAE